MYNVARNNFYTQPKNATVYTPPALSTFLFDLLAPTLPAGGVVLDPCVGAGSLLRPFAKGGFTTLGIDVEPQGFANTWHADYLALTRTHIKARLPTPPALVLANPPFNIDAKTRGTIAKTYGRRPLLPEVWLQKTLELFGHKQALALFAPYGLRLNQTATSTRWRKFLDGTYPAITSLIALPKNIYDGILFHSEILIFNIHGLAPHYFFDAKTATASQ